MSKTILYIEDNPDNMMLVERAIEALGCQFIWASTATQGLAFAVARQPGLILLDINLPDMDGYAVAQQLRALGHSPQHLPIIAVTANALKGDAEKALAAGCNGYMSKPINTRELRKQVMAWLSHAN